MKLRALRALWGLRRYTYAMTPMWSALVWLQCAGYRPCEDLVVASGRAGMILRSRIRRQSCVRTRFHRGPCLATVDAEGWPAPDGAPFTCAQVIA